MLPVPVFTCTRGADDRADSNAIMVVSDDLTLIAASIEDVLRIKSFPMFQASEMTVSPDATENSIRVTYLKDNGFELCSGSKSAVNSISMALENKGDVRMAQEMILQGQKDTRSVADTTGTENTDTAAETPKPKRSIALVNLWSPEGQQLSRALPTLPNGDNRNDSDTQDASPLQHRSQPLSQTHATRPCSNQHRGRMESETASETSFLEAAQDRQALPERLHASQSASSNLKTFSDFNVRVDDAVARHKSSKLDPKAVAPEGRPNKEVMTSDPPHLPQDIGGQALKSNPSWQNLPLKTDKNGSGKGVQQSTALSGALAVSPVSPFVRPAAAATTKKGTMAKLSFGPPPATSTLKKSTKTPGGPAARLGGSQQQGQQQGQQQASKSTSSTSDALKRKALTSRKERPSKTTDWDEDIRDDSQFDIPDDPSEEERPTKRARKGAKRPARKSAAKSSKAVASKKTQASKNNARAPGGPKKAKTEQHAEALKETVASTRERRPPKSAKYVEDSGSEVAEEEEEEEQTTAAMSRGSEEASSPIGNAAPQSGGSPTAPKKAGGERRVHSQSINIPAARSQKAQQGGLPLPQPFGRNVDRTTHQDISASLVSPEDPLPKSAARTSAPAPDAEPTKQKPVMEGAHPSEPDQRQPVDDVVAGEAQDSHPMDRAGRDAAAAAAKDSFGTHLQTQLANIVIPEHADQQDKENVPPAPETPFGNKDTFIANVNAAKSKSAKKGSISQVPKSPETQAPSSVRRSATEAKEATTTRPVSSHPAPARAPISGKKSTSKKTSQFTEEEAETLPAESPQDDPVEVADDEPHTGPTALLEQHATKGDRVASVSEAETSSDASGLGDTVLEQSDHAGKPDEVPSIDIVQPENADVALIPEASRPRESFGGGAFVDETLELPPGKRMSLAEIADSKKGQKKIISDMGSGPKAINDASKAGQSPLTGGLAQSVACNTPKTLADDIVGTREQKHAVRKSSPFRVRELQTPRRKTGEQAGTLTSEKVHKKPSVVHFEARGPVNQGVLAGTEDRRKSEASMPPPETEKNHEAKQRERVDHSAETLSHQPAPLDERSKLIPDVEDNHDPGEEGVIVDDDVEVDTARSAGDSDRGREAGEELRSHESPASIGQRSVDRPENVAVSPERDIANAASPDKIYHDASVQDLSPSSESEEEEASEYEEEVGSVDVSAEVEGSRDEEPSIQGVAAGPSAPELQDTPKAPVVSSDEVVRKPTADARDSTGLGPLLKKSNPGAGDRINTKLFRTTHERAGGIRNVDISTIPEPEIRKQATKATKAPSADDVSLMPPPKTKLRQSTGGDSGRDTTKHLLGGESSVHSHATADRMANPLAQLSTTSTLNGAELPESRDGDNAEERVATAPIRVKRRSELVPSPESALPIGTPMTFHAMLAETSAHDEEAGDRRKIGSYVSENTAEATLVNGNSLSTIFRHPTRRESRHERGMTETTDESPPPLSTGGSQLGWTDNMMWEQALRPPHRSLFEDVMQIANVSRTGII